MTDHETAAAVEALTRRLRDRGDADPEVFALEFITALRARGWRPTEAKAIPAWKPGPKAGTGLPRHEETAAEVAGTRADIEAKRDAFVARYRRPA